MKMQEIWFIMVLKVQSQSCFFFPKKQSKQRDEYVTKCIELKECAKQTPGSVISQQLSSTVLS